MDSYFSPEAQQVFAEAKRLAKQQGHRQAGEAHVAVSLLQDASIAALLEELAFDATRRQMQCESLLLQSDSHEPSFNEIRQESIREAAKYEFFPETLPIHIGLYLTASPDRRLSQLLTTIGVNLEKFRTKLSDAANLDGDDVASIPNVEHLREDAKFSPLFEKLDELERLKQEAIEQIEFEQAAGLRIQIDRIRQEIHDWHRSHNDDDR